MAWNRTKWSDRCSCKPINVWYNHGLYRNKEECGHNWYWHTYRLLRNSSKISSLTDQKTYFIILLNYDYPRINIWIPRSCNNYRSSNWCSDFIRWRQRKWPYSLKSRNSYYHRNNDNSFIRTCGFYSETSKNDYLGKQRYCGSKYNIDKRRILNKICYKNCNNPSMTKRNFHSNELMGEIFSKRTNRNVIRYR